MSSDTLPDRTAGQTIFADHQNIFKRAFVQDVVPRNSSGVATDVAGSLGTALLKWLTGHLNTLYLYTGSRFTGITRASGGSDYTLTLPNALPAIQKYMLVASDGTVTFSNPAPSYSSDITTATATSGSPVTAATKTLTTNGRPVLLGLLPLASHTVNQGVFAIMASGGDDVSVQIIWKRDSVQIGSGTFSVSNMGTDPTVSLPLSMFWHLDDGASAGSHTYELELLCNTAGGSSEIRSCRMFVYEL